VRAPLAPLLLALAATARAGASEPDLSAVREGLLAPGREARERAETVARELARTDPAGVGALWDGLDLQARCLLVRALAGAGTRHAALVALERAGDPEPEVFRALLDGLAAGGEVALFAPLAAELPAARQEALDDLRLRWHVEAEMVRLKAPWGPTGQYKGQYKKLKALGAGVLPILFDIVMDRARPLPGESAAGPYAPIHPGMAYFDPQELRHMAAYAFSDTVAKSDLATIERLLGLYFAYRDSTGRHHRFEREEIAPTLAFDLYDLGIRKPAEDHIRALERRANANFDEELLEVVWDLGYAYMRIGRYDRGERWYQRVLVEHPNKAFAAYNLACSFSLRAAGEPGERDRFIVLALGYLERAIDEGYGDWKWMEEDGDLAFLRGEPGYKALLRRLQERYPDRERGKVEKFGSR
jgi:hypothetical protein